MVEEKEISNHRKTSCFMCRQPVVEYNRFTVSWSESGEKISRVFCGSRCLRDWAEEYSENIKLDLFDEE